MIVSFDQPWGEYLSRQSFDLAPLHYADTLIRTGLGLSGLGLEINLGYWPHRSLHHNLLEIGRLLDRWSLFGLPLVVFLTIPSRSDADPLAKRKVQVLSMDADQVNPNMQAALLGPLVELCLAKPSVQGIVWNQLQDQFPHPYPHGGLYDHQGHEKPVVETLRTVRQTHFGN